MLNCHVLTYCDFDFIDCSYRRILSNCLFNCFLIDWHFSTDQVWAIFISTMSFNKLETITCDPFDQSRLWKVINEISAYNLEPIIQKPRPYMFWHIWICFSSHDIQSYCSITHLRSGCGSNRCSGTKDVLVHLILT